jgi:tetratricopeptide (TPR) repeat protein
VDACLSLLHKTLTFYGHTEEEAKAKAYAAGIPEERVIKFEVTPVTEDDVRGSAPDPEGAIEAAKARVPDSAFDVGSPEIIDKGKKGQCEMQVHTRKSAHKGWRSKASRDAILDKCECLVPPKSGFLGIGRKPGLWKISWTTPAEARVFYKLPAKVTLTYSEEEVAREEKPSVAAEVVRCSSCSNELKRLDVGIAENIPDLQQWLGNVCLRCQRVYCSRCLELGGPTPCPQCGEPTKPAQRLHLQAISVFNRSKPAKPAGPEAAPRKFRPKPAKPARSEAAPRKFKLPEIGPEFLSTEFAAPEEPAGSGAASFQEAIQASNQEEFDKAEDAFKRAVTEGLPPTCESYANCHLGILALRRGQLDRGVDFLLRCLGAEKKSANSAWEAAVRLKVIYGEAGRSEEANAFAALAATANTRGLELEGQAEEGLRKLVRDAGWQAASPPAKAA